MTNSASGRHSRLPGLIVSLLVFGSSVFFLFIIGRNGAGRFALGSASPPEIRSAITFDPGNPTYPYLLARHLQLDLTAPSPGEAAAQYRESLRLNPLQPAAWLYLSKVSLSLNDAAAADYALERAVKLSPNDPSLLWEAGSFWLMRGLVSKALTAFSGYIRLVPEQQETVYDLCWKLGTGNKDIISMLVPDTYDFRSRYLRYLIATGRINEANEAWAALPIDSLRKEDFLQYVNLLIRNHRYPDARAVWDAITARISGLELDPDPTLLWNPGFEMDLLLGGFDWIISEPEGVTVFIDDTLRSSGKRSLGISFDGSHNPGGAFARQVVPVRPGRYALSAQIKTDSITTTNGVFLFASGHDCPAPGKRSDVVTGTNFWKELTVDIDVPASCGAIVIGFQRDRSQKFDNKIGGTAWIDRVALKPLDTIQTNSSGRR